MNPTEHASWISVEACSYSKNKNQKISDKNKDSMQQLKHHLHMEQKRNFSERNLIPEQSKNGKALNGYLYSKLAPKVQANPDDNKNGSSDAMRLQILEKRNAALERLAVQRKAEISEIIALNKKYISILAHDLKSPFSSIYGVLGMLKDLIHEKKFDEMGEYIDIASSSAINTNNLIENHLAWVNAQNKKTIFNPVAINLENLMKKEIENSYLSVKLKKLSLSQSILPDQNVLADLQMMKTIMRNLINNAIKFTPTGGNITISARTVESLIEITIKDDGIGISEKHQQDLFLNGSLHYTSVANNGNRKGLGLLLCKEFIDTHGGEIHVESKLGIGSSFIFTLPKHDERY